jgi:methyltransferase family protein
VLRYGAPIVLYLLKVRLLKTARGITLWRRLALWRHRLGGGADLGNYNRLYEYVGNHVRGRSFLDVGCMWGVNGDHSFAAEDAGATSVKGVDVFGPTAEFERKKRARDSSVEFILGDMSQPGTIARVGVADVVLCAGVLYHHPSPFDLLTALRRVCRQTLILRTSTIPEIRWLPNAAVFYPMLPARTRRVWDLSRLGVGRQVGISAGFEPEEGYGNWFWGMTPSCVASLLQTAGFRIDYRAAEPFAQTFICSAVDVPFSHRLPDETGARRIAEQISAAGVALPS